ncbi:MAG: 4Fe-4S dicluster domain-containing protein [Ignavibacteriales bacterium]
MNESWAVGRARAAGIVGAGGASFPTHVKLQSRAEIYIANGAECEPLLHAGQEIMARDAGAVVRGLAYAMRATGASRGIIALKRKYGAAARAVRAAVEAAAGPSLEVLLLDDFYPAGDEHVLVYEATGRRVPAGGIPVEAGVVVNNVETLLNLAAAIETEAPVTRKWVTVCGAVRRPVTARFAVGTPFATAIELAGGPSVTRFTVLDGGPLMGKVVSDLSIPITKSTGGIVVLPDDNDWVCRLKAPLEFSLKRARSHCIQCMYCTEMCPRYLLGHSFRPGRVMTQASYGFEDPETLGMSMLCSECGLCEAYACPVGLAPRRINAMYKGRFLGQGVKPGRRMLPSADPAREYRKAPAARLKSRLGLDAYDRTPEFIEAEVVPPQVTLPLKQHVGVPAESRVKAGDRVTRGDVLADVPDGLLGAPVHASISGKVVGVSPEAVTIRGDGR